jgi:hypothetical protein
MTTIRLVRRRGFAPLEYTSSAVNGGGAGQMLPPAGVTGAAVTLSRSAELCEWPETPVRRGSEGRSNHRQHAKARHALPFGSASRRVRRWELGLSSPEGHDHRCARSVDVGGDDALRAVAADA